MIEGLRRATSRGAMAGPITKMLVTVYVQLKVNERFSFQNDSGKKNVYGSAYVDTKRFSRKERRKLVYRHFLSSNKPKTPVE